MLHARSTRLSHYEAEVEEHNYIFCHALNRESSITLLALVIEETRQAANTPLGLSPILIC